MRPLKYTQYGVVIMQKLMESQAPVPLSKLAPLLTEASGGTMSEVHAQQLMRFLLKAKLVSSARGPKGGYVPSNKYMETQSAYDIETAMNPPKKAKARRRKKTRLDEIADKIEQPVVAALKNLKVSSL